MQFRRRFGVSFVHLNSMRKAKIYLLIILLGITAVGATSCKSAKLGKKGCGCPGAF